MEVVERWLQRAEPDVLLLQETKLSDEEVPALPFQMAGYEIAHHGEGRWNGVAIASRIGLTDVEANFGNVGNSRTATGVQGEFDPLHEARMISAVCGEIRFVSVYAPNGREVDSPFFEGKLRWFERLAGWLQENCSPDEPLVVGGDMNVTPEDADVWDPDRAHGGTHVSPRERQALEVLRAWGLTDAFRLVRSEAGRFSWWDYRAGMFQRNEGMRIDLLYVTEVVARRVVWAEVDREARKGKPTPSDHAPVVVDLDEPGKAFDAGWEGAMARIAARARK